ncbi:MAG: rhodanese-like domain-containing protein [Gemmataceae bacterium]|nr:rhodanese-like domain-containing protein [Gemmataceae bacterium]
MTRFVAACVLTALSLGLAAAVDHTTDSLDTVKKNLAAKKAVLVDVREADEWDAGHLKDARHLALSDLKAGVPAEKLKEKLPPGSVVYLHCASGGRCKVAGDYLKKEGYDVRPLKDGYDNLVKAGFEKAK